MTSPLRAVRHQRGLTLEALGAATGLTKSYLSKIERELSTPSISVALKIAEAMDVDVSLLFADAGSRRVIVVDRGANSGASLSPLASDLLGKTMTPFLLRPSSTFVRHAPEHPGQEFIFVHRGSIDLEYESHIYTLQAGESAYIDASRTHRLRSTSTERADVVIVATARA